MSLRLHITDNKNTLNPFKSQLERYFQEATTLISKKVEIQDVDIWVSENKNHTISEVGIGGSTPTEKNVFIYLDSFNIELISNLEAHFKSVLTHELHHSLRHKYLKVKNTLLESVIREGLADHFDLEVNGGELKYWDNALSPSEISKLLKIAETDYDNENYNHKEWFFGSNEIPRWAGYSLGFYLVGNYLEQNKKEKASTLYAKKAEDFLL